MIVYLRPDSVAKELRLRGSLSARTKIRPGKYDVSVGDKTFHNLEVHEPHINSPIPKRVLVVRCGMDSLGLEDEINRFIGQGTAKLLFAKRDAQALGKDKDEARHDFQMTVTSIHKYAILQGHVRPLTKLQVEDNLFLITKLGLVLAKGPNPQEEQTNVLTSDGEWTGLMCFPHEFVEAVRPMGISVAVPDEGDWNAKMPPHQKESIRLEKRGDSWTALFTDKSRLVETIAQTLRSRHSCIVPLQIEDSTSVGSTHQPPLASTKPVETGPVSAASASEAPFMVLDHNLWRDKQIVDDVVLRCGQDNLGILLPDEALYKSGRQWQSYDVEELIEALEVCDSNE